MDTAPHHGHVAELASYCKGIARHHLEAMLRVHSHRFEAEPDLFGTKWFDYRFMTPFEATMVFAKEYQRLARELIGSWRDRGLAKHVSAVKEAELGQQGSRAFTGLWCARQAADALGMPYDRYLRGVMTSMIRHWEKLPRPTQLYSGPKFETHLVAAMRDWDSWRTEVSVPFSRDPRYRAENLKGHPAQLQHHDWLVEQVRVRERRHFALGNLCFTERVLPVERAVAEFGPELVERARDEAMPPVPLQPLALTSKHAPELAPGCLGLPGAAGRVAACTKCAHRDRCARLAGALDARLRTSAVQQKLADERAKTANRVRVQRFRAKQRETFPSAMMM